MPIPCYPSPIVYVVQMPPIPTPPTSDCSSDTENLQTPTFSTFDKIKFANVPAPSDDQKSDILILPLSPEPEVVEDGGSTEAAVDRSRVAGGGDTVKMETVIASCPLDIPDRRKRKNKRTNKTKKTSKNNNNVNDAEQSASADLRTPKGPKPVSSTQIFRFYLGFHQITHIYGAIFSGQFMMEFGLGRLEEYIIAEMKIKWNLQKYQ